MNARWRRRVAELIETYPRLLGVSVHNKLRAEGFGRGYSTVNRELRSIRGPRFKAAAKVSVDWTRIWYRQLTVAGIFAYGRAPYRGESREIYDVALELLAAGAADRLGMVTHVFALDEYRRALTAALDKRGHRSVKVAFRPAA